MKFTGEILSGEFDQTTDEFMLYQVKHLSTTTALNQEQFNSIYNYLSRHKHEMDGQILTLNEQMLVRLSPEESDQFVEDLNQIRSLFH
ncbi:hypothetical protein [Halobacillus sp. Marseille-P3879]|uniref:hypothetical protein n=1 Tax=Halobacillus sp. Marseille-P3879 TaxID=2045014 RepID=UPI000C7C8522|nr:hypothetical protein [Halobacillus sp. Marseille-P3879]